ncbi:type I methionyl aminopeptidase [Candidatus Neomarinimicrobiota bacterium]
MVHLRSKEEIDHIRRSGQIVAGALKLVKEMIEPGVAPIRLDREAEKYIRSCEAEPGFKGLYGYPASLCVSVDDEVVHGIPGEIPLEEGQIVGLDIGALHSGYYGDHARTFPVGKVEVSKLDLIERTRECLDLAIAQAREGNRLGDVGFAVQNHAESFGYGIVRELVGHGIGNRLHEDPQVPNFGTPGQGMMLREGMCLAIEPMINLGSGEVYTDEDGWTVRTRDGKPSAHFEHTIVITKNGAEILTLYEAN